MLLSVSLPSLAQVTVVEFPLICGAWEGPEGLKEAHFWDDILELKESNRANAKTIQLKRDEKGDYWILEFFPNNTVCVLSVGKLLDFKTL